MKKTLDVTVSAIPGHGIVATDITDYSSIGVDIQEHVMIDFLSYEGELGTSASVVSEWVEGQTPYAELPLQYDGLLYYYKLAVPKIEHFAETELVDRVASVIYHGVGNQLFVYNNTLYFCNDTSEGPKYIDDILNNSVIINNYIDAYELVLANEGSQTFYFPRLKILVYLKLQDCLVKLQKKLLLGAGRTCNLDGCSADQNLKGQVDFLLVAVYILEYLKNIGNYEEAMRILENIASCPDLCGDDLGTLKGCGCGKTI